MTVKRKVKQSNKIIDGIISVSDTIKDSSEKIKESAITKTIIVNKDRKPYAAASLVAKSVDKQLKGVIKDVNSDFKDFLTATESYLASNYAIKLTKANLEDIAKKGSELVEDLVANTNILKKDIQNILTQNLSQGVPEKQLVKSLIELYPAYERNAGTLVNTGLSRLFNDINVTKFKDSDQEYYIYAGPDDKLTRDKPCKHWVWHWFPAEELDQVSAIRNSLWNCRHSIIAATKEDTEEYPRLKLSDAN